MTKLSALASVSATREVLEAYGLSTKKSLGQHFLINDSIVQKICALSEIGEDDIVLEVGPGIGTLSIALLQKAGLLVAVERDDDLLEVLSDSTKSYKDRFVLIHKDALALSKEDIEAALGTLGHLPLQRKALPLFPNKFIANLPYAVASRLILDYFEHFSEISSATVMVQTEVAERMKAQPNTKAYGAYTVKLSLYAQVKDSFIVKPNNFFPPPRVSSTVVHMLRRPAQDERGVTLSAEALRATMLMADAAFANRRKTIVNSSKMFFATHGEKGALISKGLTNLFEAAAIDQSRRGESLSREEFIKLGLTFTKLKLSDDNVL